MNRRLGRIWHVIETSDAAEHIGEHWERREKPQFAADGARAGDYH